MTNDDPRQEELEDLDQEDTKQEDPKQEDPKQEDPKQEDPKQEDPEQVPSDDREPLELGKRILCPDGACIGVIGPDGRCKVCGTALQAESAGDSDEEDVSDDSASDEDEDEGEDEDVGEVSDEDDGDSDDRAARPSSGSGGLDLASRELCPDGVCIGVIGPDGKCKVCGKPRTWKPADDGQTEADG